jgi:hypothetical protein
MQCGSFIISWVTPDFSKMSLLYEVSIFRYLFCSEFVLCFRRWNLLTDNGGSNACALFNVKNSRKGTFWVRTSDHRAERVLKLTVSNLNSNGRCHYLYHYMACFRCWFIGLKWIISFLIAIFWAFFHEIRGGYFLYPAGKFTSLHAVFTYSGFCTERDS